MGGWGGICLLLFLGGLTPLERVDVFAFMPSYLDNKVFRSLAIAGLSFLAKFLNTSNPVFS